MIIDLQMPRRGGLEVLEALRVRSPALPVIVLTGASDPNLRTVVLGLGATQYVSKSSMDFDFLLSALRQALAGGGIRVWPRVETTMKERGA